MANTVAQKKTGTPPINADPPVLGPTTYPGPRTRPLQRPEVRPRSAPGGSRGGRNFNWDPSSFKKKKPQLDEMPAQVGGEAQVDYMPKQISSDQNKPNWADPRLQGGGVPIRAGGYNLDDWMPKPGEFGPRGGGFGPPPGAGGLNKATGQWTPPDPAYLEGLKNGTIEPEWKRKERMLNQPFLQNAGIKHYGTDIKGMPGQGGEQVPGGQAIGGPKPVYSNSGGGTLGSQNGGTVGGGPVGGGAPGRPGRQPLRPGMEYRPGGGQRPVGGGMQGAPQDGGMNQFSPEQLAQYAALQGRADQWRDAGGQGMYSETSGPGQEDPQEQMRRRLMMMQKQGPNSNPYYGAF